LENAVQLPCRWFGRARGDGIPTEIFYIASRLIEDPDDMVQKGVGWR